MRSPSASTLRRRVAANVKRLRAEARMTQMKLAEAADLDLRHVARIAAGANLTLATLATLANGLGVDVSTLLRSPPRR